jgi:hypothetical protein
MVGMVPGKRAAPPLTGIAQRWHPAFSVFVIRVHCGHTVIRNQCRRDVHA